MSQWFDRSLTHTSLIVVLGGALAGCSRAPQSQPSPATQNSAPGSPAHPGKGERARWAYDTGWFVKGNGAAWFEHNEEATRLRGGPWEFAETRRTEGYVELHDARRGVSVRLAEPVSEVRWDKDGEHAEWRPLYKGR